MPSAELSQNGRDISLSYIDEGAGQPVLLIHGFASTKEINWLGTGWIMKLAQNGFRAVAFDNRGHGASTKFYAPGDYTLQLMAADAMALAEHLGLVRPHVIGYSLGARIAAMMAIEHGEGLSRVVLSGNGAAMVEARDDWCGVRDALLAPSLDAVSDPRGRTYRAFAEQTKSDLKALAACSQSLGERVPAAALRRLENPVLVAIGTEDDVAGSGEKLVQMLTDGRFLPIAGRNHMSAVGDRTHVAGVLEFLREAG